MTISEVPAAAGGVPLSVQQEFLCMWDMGDEMGPFGPRFHIIDGWRVRGRIDTGVLRTALADVVVRHEALRTTVVRTGDRYQRILPPAAPRLDERDLTGTPEADRDVRTEELLNELAAGELPVREQPLLRAVLGRFAEDDAVLSLVAHHSAVDAWSMQLLVRDLAECYAARAAGREPALDPAVQYQDYARWQQEHAAGHDTGPARAYWRENLAGARNVALPTDRPRSAHPEFRTSWYRFSWGRELCAATAGLAREARCSPFMLLLAAFGEFLRRGGAAADLVVPTFTPGREHARFQDAVGSFFNCLPLRLDLSGRPTFRELAARARRTCLGAYTHELPFAEILGVAPGLMADVAEDGFAPCTFQVIQTPHMMDRERVGELEYSAIRRRMLPQTVGSDIPDGTLLCLELDATGDLIGELGYSSNLYDDRTARELVAAFRAVLAELVAAPDVPLGPA